MRVVSETGCDASPDKELLRNRWNQEDLLLEWVVFEMVNKPREDAFTGVACPYVHDFHKST